jgi:predicted DNA-binding antitoxin AbrB/MazE fold protein
MVLLMLLGLTPVTAERVKAADHANEVIKAIGIMETDKGNTEDGTAVVNRARFAQMLVNLSSIKDDITNESDVTLFSDVKKTYWAAGYIQTAITQGWMFGYVNGTFKPKQGVNLQEAAYSVLKILGYSDSDFSGNKISAIMKLYKTKDLGKDIKRAKTEYLTVNDCIHLFYNALNATTKTGQVYAAVLGYSLDTNGDINYLSLINSGVEGPIVAADQWESELPFQISQAKIYKYGETASYMDIAEYDVLYYSEDFKTIWVYDDKVTGTVDTINPDYTSPTSVTVGGKSYNFANSDITYRFTSMGDIKEGNVITLLLGKDGSVAGALNIDEYNVSYAGVILELGSSLEETKEGFYKTVDVVTFVDATGAKHTQSYDKSNLFLKEGGLVKVVYVDGVASVSELTLGSTSFGNNIVNKDGNMLGNTAFASNINILDLHDSDYVNIYPERLAGVSLEAYNIYYYELNSEGQISKLILNNVTNDMNKYGIYQGYSVTGNNTTSLSYLIGSASYSAPGNTSYLLVQKPGPAAFVYKDGALTDSFALIGVSVTAIGTSTIESSSGKFPLADNYSVYAFVDGKYTSTTLDKVSNLNKYRIKAYYDNPVLYGGRIRVLVATVIQ